MFFLMKFNFGSQICLEHRKIAVFEARDGFQIFEELYTPVARVVLRLIFDVIATLAIPRTHAYVFWDDVDWVREAEGRG
jgi:hypothetical protein